MTTVVHDDSSAGTELLMRSDDYNGSGEATYTGATITNGEWDLILYNQVGPDFVDYTGRAGRVRACGSATGLLFGGRADKQPLLRPEREHGTAGERPHIERQLQAGS